MLIAGLAAGVAALLPHGIPPVFRATADSPYANARALSGQGNLAFVSRGQMWVLDGSGGALRHLRVPAGHRASSPTFSPDGQWLAYVVEPTASDYYGPDQLWIAHADGSGAHRVIGVRLGEIVGWSRRGDQLAVTAGEQLRYAPYGSPTAVELVSARGPVRVLLRAPAVPLSRGGVDAVGAAVWSPTGNALAVVLSGSLVNRIETVPVSARAKPTVWFSDRESERVPLIGMAGRVPSEVIPKLAGWWSHWGIAFWAIDFGASRDLDDTALAVIARPGAQPRYLAQTLSLGVTDAVAPGPHGRLALVVSTTGGREYAMGKHLETCAARAGSCRPISGAASYPSSTLGVCLPCSGRSPVGHAVPGVSEDPAWSPNGRLLAYVKAPAEQTFAWPSATWFADHALYLWDTGTARSRRLGTVDGAAVPTWSANGRELIYESDDGLWLTSLRSGKSVEIAHPLYGGSPWNSGTISFYGQIGWGHQFAWSSPQR